MVEALLTAVCTLVALALLFILGAAYLKVREMYAFHPEDRLDVDEFTRRRLERDAARALREQEQELTGMRYKVAPKKSGPTKFKGGRK